MLCHRCFLQKVFFTSHVRKSWIVPDQKFIRLRVSWCFGTSLLHLPVNKALSYLQYKYASSCCWPYVTSLWLVISGCLFCRCGVIGSTAHVSQVFQKCGLLPWIRILTQRGKWVWNLLFLLGQWLTHRFSLLTFWREKGVLLRLSKSKICLQLAKTSFRNASEHVWEWLHISVFSMLGSI